ncbi:MAG: hypothetical protein EZS28_029525 [Streblomastix strix]|uniref:MI domain-containing protein n=1 Tax=Streblomastix strix TaxID=222440 RepID=A0A5J4UWX1_9EUKA|nr:MAG: hypothetical protein EZS28_029525 [Streblomastix strix]
MLDHKTSKSKEEKNNILSELDNDTLKSMRGYLNRLVPDNFKESASAILTLCQDNPLQCVLNSLIPLIIKMILIPQTSLKMTALYTGIISYIHRGWGQGASSTIAASILENVCNEIKHSLFDIQIAVVSDQEGNITRMQQLGTLIGSLYSYGITTSKIIFDLMELIISPPEQPNTSIDSRGGHAAMLLSIVHSTWWRLSKEGYRVQQISSHFKEKLNQHQIPQSLKSNNNSLSGSFISQSLLAIFEPYILPLTGNIKESDKKRSFKMKKKDEEVEAILGGEARDIQHIREIVLSSLGISTITNQFQDDEALDVGWDVVTDDQKRDRYWMIGASYEQQNRSLKRIRLSDDNISQNEEEENESSNIDDSDINDTNENIDNKDKQNSDQSSLTTLSSLHNLARKMRLSTSTRKAILGALMTANDCEDACEHIEALRLKGENSYDIAPVILECCAQESEYNPFYAHTAVLLCRGGNISGGQTVINSRGHLRSFTNSLRDHLRELSDGPESNSQLQPSDLRRIMHVAHFTSMLITEGGIPLSFLALSTQSQINTEDESKQGSEQIHPDITLLRSAAQLSLPEKTRALLFMQVCLGGIAAQRPLDNAHRASSKSTSTIRRWVKIVAENHILPDSKAAKIAAILVKMDEPWIQNENNNSKKILTKIEKDSRKNEIENIKNLMIEGLNSIINQKV